MILDTIMLLVVVVPVFGAILLPLVGRFCTCTRNTLALLPIRGSRPA